MKKLLRVLTLLMIICVCMQIPYISNAGGSNFVTSYAQINKSFKDVSQQLVSLNLKYSRTHSTNEKAYIRDQIKIATRQAAKYRRLIAEVDQFQWKSILFYGDCWYAGDFTINSNGAPTGVGTIFDYPFQDWTESVPPKLVYRGTIKNGKAEGWGVVYADYEFDTSDLSRDFTSLKSTAELQYERNGRLFENGYVKGSQKAVYDQWIEEGNPAYSLRQMVGTAYASQFGKKSIIFQIGCPYYIENVVTLKSIEGSDSLKTIGQAYPILVDNRTLIPIRPLVDLLGGTVSWDSNTETATINWNGNSVQLTINHKNAIVNGNAAELEVPAQLNGGKTMVPLRFVTESLAPEELEVSWTPEYQLVAIRHGKEVGEKPTTMTYWEYLEASGYSSWREDYMAHPHDYRLVRNGNYPNAVIIYEGSFDLGWDPEIVEPDEIMDYVDHYGVGKSDPIWYLYCDAGFLYDTSARDYLSLPAERTQNGNWVKCETFEDK